MSMLKEFKEFALRGNVVDMAVGVVIGAAFGKSFLPWSVTSSCRPWAIFWEALTFPISSFRCPAFPFLPWQKPRKWEFLSLHMASF